MNTPITVKKSNRIKNSIIHNNKRYTCRIYDYSSIEPDQFDKYTIALKGYRIDGKMVYPFLSSSNDPFHPDGVCQHGKMFVFIDDKCLGKRVSFEDVPEAVRKFIIQNL